MMTWDLRHRHLVCVTLLVFLLLPGSVSRAEEGADPYDVLYDVLMTRYGPDGKSYAKNETSPVILPLSGFPFGDKTYEQFVAAMDAFGALPQETIEAYSDVKRALLQRHLWEVFDATRPYSWRVHKHRRAAVQPRIATLIRRLALPREQIQRLPNTLTRTVEAGGFARRHDPKDQFKPFLPAGIYSDESSWICLETPGHPISAPQHTGKLVSRSVFLQFMSLPGGRNDTAGYFEKWDRNEVFPVGTQFALIEQAFLVSDDCDLILSPLIVSVQLRAYLDVDRHARRKVDGRLKPTQCVSEFVMQPRQLMKGLAVLRATGPGEFRFEAGQVDCGCFGSHDPFETKKLPTITRLNECMRCHGAKGLDSIQTHSFREGSPETISEATAAHKRNDSTWKTLQAFWLADVKREDNPSLARAD